MTDDFWLGLIIGASVLGAVVVVAFINFGRGVRW